MRTRANTSATRPAVTVTAPARSRWRCAISALDSGRARRAATSATTPTGTLTKRIQRQLKKSVRMPPKSAPAEAPADGHGAPDPQCPGAGRALGERRRQDGQGGGRQDGGSQALQGPGADQPGLALRHAAEQARHGEDGQAHHEDPPPTEQVGCSAAEKEEPGEGQRVGVDDPLEVRGAEVQVALDGREGDVDDGGVEHDHELADADDAEDDPRRDVPARFEFDCDAAPGVGGHDLPLHSAFRSVRPRCQPTSAGLRLFPP